MTISNFNLRIFCFKRFYKILLDKKRQKIRFHSNFTFFEPHRDIMRHSYQFTIFTNSKASKTLCIIIKRNQITFCYNSIKVLKSFYITSLNVRFWYTMSTMFHSLFYSFFCNFYRRNPNIMYFNKIS